jgi:hypothetical protein
MNLDKAAGHHSEPQEYLLISKPTKNSMSLSQPHLPKLIVTKGYNTIAVQSVVFINQDICIISLSIIMHIYGQNSIPVK